MKSKKSTRFAKNKMPNITSSIYVDILNFLIIVMGEGGGEWKRLDLVGERFFSRILFKKRMH